MKINLENIPPHMRECVEALARSGRDTQRIWACTGIPKLVIYRVFLEMEDGDAA